jgi:hypothetical protein
LRRASSARAATLKLIQVPVQLSVSLPNRLRYAADHMTFIIEAAKDGHYTTSIRASAIVAVILARKLAADGFAVSIRAPTGQLYSADRFNLLLTGESLSSQDSR